MSTLTDQDLLLAIRRSDDHAFSIFVRRHKSLLVDYAFQLSGNESFATDVAQQVLLAIHRGELPRRALPDPLTWMLRTAGSIVRRHERVFHLRTLLHRRRPERTRQARFEQGIAPDSGIPAWEKMSREHQMRGALAGIPFPLRQLLTLRDLLGFPPEEIARVTGGSVSSVRAGIDQARAEFADALRAIQEP